MALEGGPRTARGEVMIRLDNVTKVYGNDTIALERVNLGIDSGEFVFLVGASGSGKSTIVRLILKEMEPSAGVIYVNGTRLSSVPRRRIPRLRRGIGCVFQDFKLLPNKTAAENVAYAMEVTGQRRRTIRTKVPQILDLVGLSGKMDKFPEMLSGGEQQRVSIARAFCTAAHPRRRRADGQPGPHNQRRYHAALAQDQPHRHHRPGRDPRQGDGGRNAQAGSRLGGGAYRTRQGKGGVRR